MKKLNLSQKLNASIIMLLLCLGSFNLEAQKTETLFGRAKSIGAFGGPIVEYHYSGNDVDVLAGGGGALIINDFWIGGYGDNEHS